MKMEMSDQEFFGGQYGLRIGRFVNQANDAQDRPDLSDARGLEVGSGQVLFDATEVGAAKSCFDAFGPQIGI
jgi:hypothetical protein